MSFGKDYEPQLYRELVQNEAKISELTKELIKKNPQTCEVFLC